MENLQGGYGKAEYAVVITEKRPCSVVTFPGINKETSNP